MLLLLATVVTPSELDLMQPVPLFQFLTRVVKNQKRNRLKEMSYSYRFIRQEKKFDTKGSIKNRKSATYEVIPLVDRMYRKLVTKNGEALSKSEARDQEKKLSVQLEEQKNLSSEALFKLKFQRAERRRKETQFWDETLKAFHFLYLGKDIQDGQGFSVIKLWPNKGYELTNKNLMILKKLQGQVWIDPVVSQIVRAQVTFIEDFKLGGGLLAKVNKGATLVFEQERIKDKIWFPSHFEFDFKGRFLFFKRFNVKVIGDFTNYKKSSSSNDLVLADPDLEEIIKDEVGN